MSKNNDTQHVYLYMDDSGKISSNETYSIFAGIVFYDKAQKSEFINKYKKILNDIKCSYCNYDNEVCKANCPEIKGSSISKNDRRRVMNLSKKFITFGTTIYNNSLKIDIKERKDSKGRFVDYAQKRVIKEIINYLISRNIINPNKDVYLHINIDQMPTKSNGYYNLKESIYEELKHGTINFNYGCNFRPILYGKLNVEVIYKNSKLDVSIQMADIIANTVRRNLIRIDDWNQAYDYLTKVLKINVILKLP